MADDIFVDSGAWLALADRADQWHIRAQETFALLLHDGNRLITTNLVIAETYNLIRRRLGHTAAVNLLHSTRLSPRLERVYSTATLELKAEVTLERFAGQDFSFVDAVSFEVMRDRRITQAFAFDHHFLVSGFLLVPS